MISQITINRTSHKVVCMVCGRSSRSYRCGYMRGYARSSRGSSLIRTRRRTSRRYTRVRIIYATRPRRRYAGSATRRRETMKQRVTRQRIEFAKRTGQNIYSGARIAGQKVSENYKKYSPIVRSRMKSGGRSIARWGQSIAAKYRAWKTERQFAKRGIVQYDGPNELSLS